MESEPMLTPKEKSPLPEKFSSVVDGTHDTASSVMLEYHARVSQGRICSEKCTYCHTETQFADYTFYLVQSQWTDTGPTSPSAGPATPGASQDSHRSTNF